MSAEACLIALASVVTRSLAVLGLQIWTRIVHARVLLLQLMWSSVLVQAVGLSPVAKTSSFSPGVKPHSYRKGE